MSKFLDTFEQLDDVLLLGGGGGFDVFLALPLYRYFARKARHVEIASYSFTDDLYKYPKAFDKTPFITKIDSYTKRTKKNKDYFPEHDLSSHLKTPIYAIRQIPPDVLAQNLNQLLQETKCKTIIALDAGFDGLMYGYERHENKTYYASPLEDMACLIALVKLQKMKICNVFWVCASAPTEGIPFSFFYRNLADQIHEGGFKGCLFPFTDNEEKFDYAELLDRVNPLVRSIPNESILACLFGGNNQTHLTNKRLIERFENENPEKKVDVSEYPPVFPLTGIYWFFDVEILRSRSPLVKYLYANVFRQSKYFLSEMDIFNGSLTVDDSTHAKKMINFHEQIRIVFEHYDESITKPEQQFKHLMDLNKWIGYE